MSLLIKNGKVYTEGKFVEKNILIADERISEISNERHTVDRVIDARGCLVVPGMIDPHVHLREPGLEYKEDFLSGSRAAAAGGVTTFLDMPNNKPPILRVEDLDKKRELAKKSVVNYGFHFGSSFDNVSEIKKARNIASVKVYMNETTGDLLMNDDSYLANVFATRNTISVHAEGERVKKAISLIKETKNRLYLCHLSTKEEVDAANKSKNAKVYKEVTPHHLFLSEEDVSRLGNFGKIKPNLKSKQEQNYLWEALSKGRIDTIGSDHAPHTLEDKKNENCYGVPGLETTLPLLFDAVNRNQLKMEDVSRLCSENPARIFKIRDRGLIKEEYYADLIIVDMKKEKKVENGKLFTKCNWSPFDGKILKGWPIITIVNGRVVFEKDSVFDEIKGREVKYEAQLRKGNPSEPGQANDGGGKDSSEGKGAGQPLHGDSRGERQKEDFSRDEGAV